MKKQLGNYHKGKTISLAIRSLGKHKAGEIISEKVVNHLIRYIHPTISVIVTKIMNTRSLYSKE